MAEQSGYPTAADALDLYRRGQAVLAEADKNASGLYVPATAFALYQRALALFAASTAATNLALLGPISVLRESAADSLP